MNRREVIASLATAALPVFGRTRNENVYCSRARPAQVEVSSRAVTNIGGFAGRRMELNITGRLLRFDIEYYVRLIETHGWRDWSQVGEQAGKWLEASILCSGTFQNEQLYTLAASVLKRMIAAQQRDGYLGVTDSALRTPEQPLRGMDAYELYFTIHALLTAFEEWKSDAALSSAVRIGDYLARYIGPGKAGFWPGSKERTIAGHGFDHGLGGTLLIDPVMRLYENTGGARYLNWCQWVVGNIDRWSGTNCYSHLDDVARGEPGVDHLLPRVHAHTFQMNALGLMRMYFATGDLTYLNNVRGACDDIRTRCIYITGAPGYRDGHNLPTKGEGIETCSVSSWIQLNQALLNATGDPAHADIIERAMWNHAYASQTSDGDGFSYGVPMAGSKPARYFTGPNCCSSSGPRLLGLLPSMIYAYSENSIYINQFMESKAQIHLDSAGTVELSQRTEYPTVGRILLEIRPSSAADFELKIRIPSWCATPAVLVNGRVVPDVQSGSYAHLHRTWRAGDKVEVKLSMNAEWVSGDHGNAGWWALTRGPVVYVADGVWQNSDSNITCKELPALKLQEQEQPAELKEMNAPEDALGPFYVAAAKLKDGRAAEMVLSPFANLGRWYADPNARPDIKAELYDYSVWLPGSTGRSECQG